MSTGIQWTDETWNPVTGCSKVSPGCAHCYAETVAARFWPTQYGVDVYWEDGIHVTRHRRFTDVMCHEDRLDQPLRWKKPRKVFVNSMSDLFHEDVPDAFIDRVFAVMALAPRHTFQVLTKRPARMKSYLDRLGFEPERIDDAAAALGYCDDGPDDWPMPNVWLGVSVENQHFADERIPLLLQTPAAVRFISAEPLLGPVKLHLARFCDAPSVVDSVSLRRLDWVIVGGESGRDARPFDLRWARSIVEQCKAADVPVFVKQLGDNPQENGTTSRYKQSERGGGDIALFPAELQVREFPNAAETVA